ncbi:penicillin-binding transpeptidase domain-containing protein [Dermacoccaceae bacterium W4C1]
MRRSPVLTAVVAGAVLAGGVGGYMAIDQWRSGSAADDGARSAANLLASSWEKRTLDQARYVGTSGSGAAANFKTATAALGNGKIDVSVGDIKRSGERATTSLKVAWTLRDGGVFTWVDPVTLVKSGESWGVQVPEDTSLWHPELTPNAAFRVSEADTAQRGEILGRGGVALMKNQNVYDIALDPQKATADSASSLGSLVGQSDLESELSSAKAKNSTALIPVITYRKSDYDAKENQISALTGVTVTTRTQPLAESRTFGQPLLGTVGTATAEMIKKNPKLRAGEVVGRSGLQSQFDASLRPKGGLTVTAGTGKVLYGTKTAAGTNLQTTLDAKVQRAAEAALSAAGDSSPAAIVATDVKTGDVLAIANSPTNGIDRALTGRYQPGSTLKVSTTYALLTSGFDANTAVPCPSSITVDGRRIGNFESETLPEGSPFTDSFAHSCNTAFVKASESLPDDAMHKAALSLGIGVDWTKQLGINAYTGSVPTTTGKVDHAAESFGQAKTLASPLSITVMTGSIARGTYIPPALIVNSGADRTPKNLDGNAVTQIKSMMRKVVTDGTGTALQGTPGGDVYAKTGTAEFDGADGPESRAWLTGWQGDIAFTVFIEEVPLGSGGGDKAAPVAKDFLTRLNQAG